jgi:hypothetical protein
MTGPRGATQAGFAGRQDRGLKTTTAARRSRWVVVALVAACLAMAAFSFASVVFLGARDEYPNPPGLWNFLVVTAVFLSFPTVGAVVATLRPRHPIGWLFLAIGFGFTVSVFSTEYVGRSVYLGAELPGFVAVAWFASWSLVAAVGIALTWVALLFPTGRLLGPRWRIVAGVATAAIVTGALAVALAPGPLPDYDGRVANPLGAPAALAGLLAVVSAISFPIVALMGIVSIGSLVVRFRRAHLVEREQVKWFLSACSALLVTIPVAIATGADALFYLAMLAFASIPVAAGIAILRYRLFEIDRIVSRTIAYSVVVAILGTVFIAAILVLQGLLAPLTNGSTIAIAASTLVVFALFQPVLRRVRRTVDRRFDRARYDAERTAAAFAERLRDEVDLRALADDLRATTRASLAPAAIGLWIRGSEGEG